MAATTSQPTGDGHELRRSVGFWQVTVRGIGIVIGAGFYVLIGPATEDAQNAVWLAFFMAAVLSALTGLSYAELAGMFPSAGAEYAFARHAFNEFAGFVVGWMMIAANLIAAAAVSIGFAHYLRHFVDVDLRVGAVALLVVLTVIIAGGIQRSIWFSVVLVILQVGGLILVIVAGVPHIGSTSLLEGGSVSGVFGAAALIFFAFIGFDEIVTLSEETRDAAKVIPRALLLALGVSATLYVIVAIASISVIGAPAIAGSDTPLTLVIAHDWGSRAGDIVAAIALASTTNTTLLVLTAASRLLFGMSRDGSLPYLFSSVTVGGRAPYIAAVAACVVAVSFALIGDIGLVASVTDFAVYGIFIAVNVSLIVLRFRAQDVPRTFVTPFRVGRVPVLPLLGIATVLLMIGNLEWRAWLIGLAIVAAGVLLWSILRSLRIGRDSGYRA
jgi:APA family basic amino acid/polyamine antiporter